MDGTIPPSQDSVRTEMKKLIRGVDTTAGQIIAFAQRMDDLGFEADERTADLFDALWDRCEALQAQFDPFQWEAIE